ncbi:reverse transcriptase family protein [Rhodopseudomonas palustris]|uniref:reverse transcriptase family protein n=1 Tax=Rhodopseudomonas palustris TaxID=1076 RepID=UPI000B09B427|nr:reverse transcriptase family protein [Rhodopseudomonas palustris]
MTIAGPVKLRRRKRARLDLKLSECGLYALASPAHLAGILSTPGCKFSVEELQGLSRDEGNFRLFDLVSDGGKARRIEWPKRRLQQVQRRIHVLLSRVEVPDYLHSAVRGKSYLTNAAVHSAEMPTVKLDVKKFFVSVPRVAVFNFFATTMKCRPDVAGLLSDLLTFDAHLPTGGAASPIMAYYAFKSLFDEIYAFASSQNVTMTCYVDDMTFSGGAVGKRFLYEVRRIVARHGLKSHKSRMFDARQPKVVTGVCNTTDGARVPNKLHAKIKDGFDKLSKADGSAQKAKILPPLLGRLEAAGQIDPRFKARAVTLRAAHQSGR